MQIVAIIVQSARKRLGDQAQTCTGAPPSYTLIAWLGLSMEEELCDMRYQHTAHILLTEGLAVSFDNYATSNFRIDKATHEISTPKI